MFIAKPYSPYIFYRHIHISVSKMGYTDLPCLKSSTVARGIDAHPRAAETLYLGCNYSICLFFQLPPTHLVGSVVSAELTLFKIPNTAICMPLTPPGSGYRICPLREPFSIYTSCYSLPQAAEELAILYEDLAHTAHTSIDISSIAQAWMAGNPQNRGLLLTAAPDARHITYASERHEVIGMRPTLRLVYQDPPLPLSVATCMVKA